MAGGTAGLPTGAGQPEQRVPAKGDKGKLAPSKPVSGATPEERPVREKSVRFGVKPCFGVTSIIPFTQL